MLRGREANELKCDKNKEGKREGLNAEATGLEGHPVISMLEHRLCTATSACEPRLPLQMEGGNLGHPSASVLYRVEKTNTRFLDI